MTSTTLNPEDFAACAVAEPGCSLAPIDVLHAAYGQRIFRFLLGSLRDRDLAETLTQDTFVRAWTARDQFRGECSAATWLTRIAFNLLRDHTRTDRFRFWRNVARTSVDASGLSGFLPHLASSSESALIARQQLELVWDTVAALPARQNAVFLLRFVEELDLNEIATVTGMPVSTVKTHLYRALAAVRKAHQPVEGTKR